MGALVIDVDDILGLLDCDLDCGCCHVGVLAAGAHMVIGLPDLVI